MEDRYPNAREEVYSVQESEDIIQTMRPVKVSSRITLVHTLLNEGRYIPRSEFKNFYIRQINVSHCQSRMKRLMMEIITNLST